MKLIDFDKLLDSLTGYIETKVELIKLDIESEVHKIIAKAVIMVFIAVPISLAVILLSVGASFLLNHLFESEYLGFGIISLLYLAFAWGVYMRRESIQQSILDNIGGDSESDEE